MASDETPLDPDLERAAFIRSALKSSALGLGLADQLNPPPPCLILGWEGRVALVVAEVPDIFTEDVGRLREWIDARSAPVVGGVRNTAAAMWALRWTTVADDGALSLAVLIKFRTSPLLLARSSLALPEHRGPAATVPIGGGLTVTVSDPSGCGGTDWTVLDLSQPSSLPWPLADMARAITTPEERRWPDDGMPPAVESLRLLSQGRDALRGERAEEAMGLLMRVVELGDPLWRSQAQLDLAYCYALTGNIDQCSAACEMAVIMATEDHEIPTRLTALFTMACLRYARGDMEGTRAALAWAFEPFDAIPEAFYEINPAGYVRQFEGVRSLTRRAADRLRLGPTEAAACAQLALAMFGQRFPAPKELIGELLV